MESSVQKNRKQFQFTGTWTQELICEASGRYFRRRYASPQALRNDFFRRGLAKPAHDTARRWLSGEDAPSLKRAGPILAAGFTDYLIALSDAVFIATDAERRERQRLTVTEKYKQEMEEIDASEAIDLGSRLRTGVARGDVLSTDRRNMQADSEDGDNTGLLDIHKTPSHKDLG